MIFQHLETVTFRGKIITIGRTKENESVAVVLNNVNPYIITSQLSPVEIYKINRLMSVLVFMKRYDVDEKYNYNLETKLSMIENGISIKTIEGQDITQFNETGTSKFSKITTNSLHTYYYLKKILQGKDVKDVNVFNNLISGKSTYEINNTNLNADIIIYNDQVDIPTQHFIDNDWYTCAWFEAKGILVDKRNSVTKCDYEFEGILKKVDMTDLAPWRVLSYDIESLPPPRPNQPGKFDFPVATNDPIITIGATLTMDTLEYYLWILYPKGQTQTKEMYNVDGFEASRSTVYTFDDEVKLIEHFIGFINKKDVDFIQGHNINRFDNDYILTRYQTLTGKKPNMSRVKYTSTEIRKSTFSSSQKGSLEKFKLIIPGRVVMDSYDIMKDQHNESSYKLDNLAEKYLGTKKIDMDYALIYPKYQTEDGRTHLAVYCLKDAWLVHELMAKLCKLTVILQMANVTGISMKDVIDRGQGIRTVALMIRYAKNLNYFIPRVETGTNEDSFEGAVVVSPTPGYYTNAVSCLDFASLYPSIMQAMNMSHETLVTRKQIEKYGWKEDVDVRTIPDYELVDGKLVTTHNPNNPAFLTREKRLGLLPMMLDTILKERKKVKKMMKKEVPHSTMYNVMDGRQLGLKVVCNSIYGFCGATHGFLPCKTIASSVTKYGRGLILKTKSLIENHVEWGRDGHGCKCIYGDTDSVFVLMPKTLVDGATKEELVNNAHNMGEIMAEYVTKQFLKPVFLEYEKTYSPYLLLKKKRYVGMKFEPGLPPKLHMKGIEAVRRDFAPLLVHTQKKFLDYLIKQEDKKKACEYVRNVVQDLFKDKLPLEQFIMSKKLSQDPSEYKSKAPHVELAIRMAKIDKTTAPLAGDRVQYVIHSGSALISKRACVPADVESGKRLIDRNYYYEKQLRIPLLRLMGPVVRDADSYFKVTSIKKRPPSGKNIFASWTKKIKINKA